MEPLKKNQVYTVEITGYTAEGAGVARIGGAVVFVKGALAGETCLVQIIKVGKTVSYGKVNQVITPSPHRQKPPCPYFEKCGGCSLMHMDYQEELAFKLQKVRDALERIGGVNLTPQKIHGAPSRYGYRNKAIFAVGERSGAPVLGFFRSRSHDVIPVETCMIQAETANRAAGAVWAWMRDTGFPPYREANHSGALRHVFCRHGFSTGQTQVTLVSASEIPAETALLVSRLQAQVPGLQSVIWNENCTWGNTVLAGDFTPLWGSSDIEDCLCGLRFSLSPRSFYQINAAQAENLYAKVLEYAALSGTETALDLYCGTGTITLCLARAAGRVIGAEIVEEAVEDARANAARNGISNASFYCADAAQIAATLQDQGLRPTVITVDPPRKGLALQVIQSVAAMAPERVVYVSCDPATLARDVKLFSQLGYAATAVEVFDMFPCTSHVETIVLLQRETL